MYQGQLADLREYSANPWVKDLNSKAIRDKHRHQRKHLSRTSLHWPDGFEIGKSVQWETHHTKDGRVSGWRPKQGRIIAINQWHATVDTGKYLDSIMLKDLYVGRARLV